MQLLGPHFREMTCHYLRQRHHLAVLLNFASKDSIAKVDSDFELPRHQGATEGPRRAAINSKIRAETEADLFS